MARTKSKLNCAGFDNVTLMARTTAFGVYDGNVLGLVERAIIRRRWRRARKCLRCFARTPIVFATGAIERPLVFSNNDRPGVMLASAARTYLNRFAVLPGRKAVVATTNDAA